jgi:hypothetical protein
LLPQLKDWRDKAMACPDLQARHFGEVMELLLTVAIHDALEIAEKYPGANFHKRLLAHPAFQ